MKKIIFILTILFFQQQLYSQKEVVGKVEFYKSCDTDEKISMSTSENEIKSLNSRNQQIEINLNGKISEYKTNENGIFKFAVYQADSMKIVVNKKSDVLNETFHFKTADLNDTIRLKISDKKVSLYRDSISSPEFYQKYNEQQAYSDFKNGRKRILAGGGFIAEKSWERRNAMTEKYGIEYDYLIGCVGLQSEFRIMYRYNEVIKKLLGIKNV
ncbi:MAG: hypothetical protein Q8O62_11360 [Aequorivita sp.]|nr:hypothetical protein [Aequorivita sp.]